MQIFVLSSSTTPFQVSHNDTVEHLKGCIESKLGTTPEEQRLIFAGRQLEDGRCLGDYNLQNGSTLHLSLRLLGSAQLGKPVKGKSKEVVRATKKIDAAQRLERKVQLMAEMDLKKKLALKAKARLRKQMEMEQKYGRMNQMKIQNQWRKIMRIAKVQSLRSHIDIIKQSHERDVDRKDAILQMLDRDTEEAEEQYQMALRSHLQNIDRLLELQDSRLAGLEIQFTKELNEIDLEFSKEREYIDAEHERERDQLLEIIDAVMAEEAEREVEAKQEFDQMREEIRNKNLEDINVLRITLEGKIEELERRFENAHMNYLQNTDKRTQDFKYLTRKDQELRKDIEHKIRKIERLQSAKNHWMTKINQNEKECRERNQHLQDEKDTIVAHFQQLKAKMNSFRSVQKKRLALLTVDARNTKKTLVQKQELAQRILTLAELARKLESEQEKVLPFKVDEEIAEQLATASAEEKAQHSEGGAAAAAGEAHSIEGYVATALVSTGNGDMAPVEEWNYLDNFYKKYNKVLMDKLTIEKEQARLEQENADLQAILKQYLDGISVTDEVMNSANPLLVVNGKVNLNSAPVQRDEKVTAIDGNQMVNTGRVGAHVSYGGGL
eukprot:INCI7773.1.p1 GENE.INCI7773.1~~INCI7773.1.p1  ORF type:complete len:609 (-),score=160.37 INCI7773.1:103-1929(-)